MDPGLGTGLDLGLPNLDPNQNQSQDPNVDPNQDQPLDPNLVPNQDPNQDQGPSLQCFSDNTWATLPTSDSAVGSFTACGDVVDPTVPYASVCADFPGHDENYCSMHIMVNPLTPSAKPLILPVSDINQNCESPNTPYGNLQIELSYVFSFFSAVFLFIVGWRFSPRFARRLMIFQARCVCPIR